VSVWKNGSGLHREVLLWVKAGTAYRKGNAWARQVTVYLDDTSGHRIRTVPDMVTVEVKPPAQVVGAPRIKTANGEATMEILYGAGQQVANLLVKTVPPEGHRAVTLPLSGAVSAQSEASKQLDEESVTHALELARDALARGKTEYASRHQISAATEYLRANDFRRAGEMFAQCEAQFPDSRWADLCAFGQLQAARRSGQADLVSQSAARLIKQYPTSIPAQFTEQKAGEVWFVPHF
jgi:hypothetical protein